MYETLPLFWLNSLYPHLAKTVLGIRTLSQGRDIFIDRGDYLAKLNSQDDVSN